MRPHRRSLWKTLNELTDMIELLIDCHPQGFGVLLGEVPPPVPEEIHAMMDARREHDDAGVPPATSSGVVEAERIVWDTEKFEAVVKAAGGWFHITKISQEYKKAAPKAWAVVIDHVKYIHSSASRLDESRLGYIARKHGTTKKTVMKYRRELPFELARAILLPPADGDLTLHSW